LLPTRSPLDILSWIGQAFAFGVRAGLASIRAILRPSWWLRPFYHVLVGALPLAFVTGLCLGVVIWMHTRSSLERAGAGAAEYLPTVLSAAVLLELAPIAAGLILSARTGASLGAELASMKVSEQIDALAMLGVSPLRRLIGPRVLACVLAAPILYVIIATVALTSGYGAEALGGQTTLLKYQTAVLRELYLADVIPAALKTLVFGLIVGVVGCYLGVTASEGSEGVGRSATDSVVVCSLLVLLADVMLVGLIKVAM